MRTVVLYAAALLTLLLPCGARAQSIYGMNYIGEAVHLGSSRHEALGYSAIAVQDTSNSVTANPASTADLRMVTLTVQQVLSASRVYYLEYTSKQTRYTVPTFTASFPFREGLVLTSGYRTRYYGRADFAYQIDIEGAPTGYQNYKLDSNMYMIPVIVAWKPFSSLRVAGEAQFNLGSIIDKVNVWFDDLNYKNVDSKRTRSYTGLSWGAALLWEAHPRLWLGGNVDGAVDYRVEESIENTVSERDTNLTYDYKLPLAWDVGLSLQPFGRWWLSVIVLDEVGGGPGRLFPARGECGGRDAYRDRHRAKSGHWKGTSSTRFRSGWDSIRTPGICSSRRDRKSTRCS